MNMDCFLYFHSASATLLSSILSVVFDILLLYLYLYGSCNYELISLLIASFLLVDIASLVSLGEPSHMDIESSAV